MQQMLSKARCVRQHGTPNFPDPTFGPGGEGVDNNLPSDWNNEAPAVIKARKACAQVGIEIPGAGVAWFGPRTGITTRAGHPPAALAEIACLAKPGELDREVARARRDLHAPDPATVT